MARAVSDEHLRTLVRARIVDRAEADELRATLIRRGDTEPTYALARRVLAPTALGLWVAAATLAVSSVLFELPLARAGVGAVALAFVVVAIARFFSARPARATVVDLLDQLPEPAREPAGRALAAWHPLAFVVALVLWIGGGAAAVVGLEAVGLARNLGVVPGIVLLALGAVTSRLPRPHRLPRHLGLALGVLGVLLSAKTVLGFAFASRADMTGLALVVGGALIAGFRVRVALWTLGVLVWMGDALRHAGDHVDDLGFAALCAAATVALFRKGVPLAASVTLGAVVLVATFIEAPALALPLRANLGSASSLGVIACALGASAWVLREATWQVRAFIAAFIVALGAYGILAPEWLAILWIGVLAAVSRSRDLAVLVALATGAHLWAMTAGRFALAGDVAASWTIAGLLLAAAAVTLMRLVPRESPSLRAHGATSTAA